MDAATDEREAVARSFAEMLSQQTGEPVELSPGALPLLDDWIDRFLVTAEVYRGAEPPDLSAAIESVALFVGTILTRSLRARWRAGDGQDARSLVLELPDGRTIDLGRFTADVFGGERRPAFTALYHELAGRDRS